MTILKTKYICNECGPQLNKCVSQFHERETGHLIRKEIEGLPSPSYDKIVVVDYKKVERKVANYFLSEQIIKEEIKWQNKFLGWIKEQKRRFRNG